MNFISQVRNKMTDERLIFLYRGNITEENSIPLLQLLEKEMENAAFSYKGRKRLFMFVLESLQNVTRHSDKSGMQDMSLLVYSSNNDGHTVTTANVMRSCDVAELRDRLQMINNLRSDEIRDVYRQMLTNPGLTEKGGAGLGIIEMAKKTGTQLDYDFLKIDDKNAWYVLSKTVNKEGIGEDNAKTHKLFRGDDVSRLGKFMAENNIYLMWSGQFTPDAGREMLSFTETKLTENDTELNIRKKVFSILVEIIENVAEHTAGKEAGQKYGMPLLVLRLEDNIYKVSTGNLIANEKIDSLRNKLEKINSLDKNGIKELFTRSLNQQTKGSAGTGNLGLIDMARKSGEKLEFFFEEINSDYSYYILEVKVEDKSNL